MKRVFLLSPASASGLRAAMLLQPRASFDLARRIRSSAGAPLGEVYTFLSGLYFRGKLEYASRFAPGSVWIITPASGLMLPTARVRRDELQSWAQVPIATSEPAYRLPLERDAKELARSCPPDAEIVLLGSIATDKYCSVLLETFGSRLVFPPAFVGRGDMSRGGLLLRSAREGVELPYVPIAGATLHGPRPSRLERPARSRT